MNRIKVLFTGLFLLTILILNYCSKNEENKMIISPLSKAEKYYSLHPSFTKAFEFLQRPDLSFLAAGTYEIDGKNVFCILQEAKGRSRDEAKLEAHKKYIDIQYIVSGDETMGWKPTADCKEVAEEYSIEKDIMFFNDVPDEWNKVPAGSFTIFFPKDAHAPLVGNDTIKKAVVKIAVE